MYIEVGAFDAKSQLSSILQEVKKGKRYTITLRGKPIADLIPSDSADHSNLSVAVDEMRKINKIKGVTTENLLTWIAEGRK